MHECAPFVICIHDASPVFARETQRMIRDLAPLAGRRMTFGVVPDWHGEWPLTAHPDYCNMLRESSEELLLHGCVHQRRRGRGMTTWLTGGSDEMNGLSREETVRTLERGQRIFADVFGKPARVFLPPAWQRGYVRAADGRAAGIENVMGFFSLESSTGGTVPLATWTWDCGRWGFLGYMGHGIGSLRHFLRRGVPVLAIHPRDLERGFWPRILRLTRDLLESGREPTTPAGLLRIANAEVGP